MPWRRSDPCDVLVVCTGNVARSPYVAARLADELPGLVVRSAGTGALVGEPPVDGTLDELRRRGISMEGIVARQVRRGHLRGARLVVTAEQAHRVRLVQLAPGVADRTFTLRELARIVAAADPTPVGLVEVLAAGRAAVDIGDDLDHDDDLADPYGGSPDDYAVMAATADAAVDVLVPALGGRR